MSSGKNPRRFLWVQGPLLVAYAIGIFWALNPLRYFFLNDDFVHVPIASDGTLGHHNGGRHVNDLSLYLDYLWSGENAAGYHFTNALLHLLNTVLLWSLFRKLAQSMGVRLDVSVSWFFALLFLAYACHSEAVFWILCRTASLSLLLMCLAWLFLLKTEKAVWYIFPSLSCFVLGLFTYETIWLYPVYVTVWLAIAHAGKMNLKKYWMYAGITWLFFIAYLPLRQWLINEVISPYEARHILDPNPTAIAGQVARLFIRSFVPPISETNWLLAAGICALSMLAFLGYRIIRHRLYTPWWWFLLFCWLVSYLPFVSLGVSATGYESDRYLYFLSAFLCAWIIYSLWLLLRQYPLGFKLVCALMIASQLFFFLQAADDYEKAGNLSKNSLRVFSHLPSNKSVEMYNLPLSWQGIPVFRDAFKHAVSWRIQPADTNRFVIMSWQSFRGGTVPTISADSMATPITIRFDQAVR